MTERAAEQTARISRELHAHLIHRPNADCMLLLDSVLRPVLEGDALWAPYSQFEHFLVKFAHREIDPAHYPVLLPLRVDRFEDSLFLEQSIGDALQELAPASLQSGAGRRISGWLTSQAPAKQVARHLARAMVQHQLPKGQTVWLRLQDPAVLWCLWSLLTPAQRQVLLGPIEAFWLLDPAGRLIALQAEPSAEAGPGVTGSGLSLTPQQWQDIEDIEPLNLALREWSDVQMVGDQLERVCLATLTALRRARALGFNDRRDLAAYAQHALEVHPRFDLHPLVQERLARRKDEYFTHLIGDLDAQDWQRIAHECSEPTISTRKE